MTALGRSAIRTDPHEACPFCGCAATGKAPRKARAKVDACAELATCWRWDHTCYAQRMRSRATRHASPAGPIAPVMLRGRVVPNLTIAA